MANSKLNNLMNAFKKFEILILILSLLFIAYQSYLQTKALNAQSESLKSQVHSVTAQIDQNLTQQNFEIYKYFLEYPETRKYFYDKKTLPTNNTKSDEDLVVRVETIAEIYLDFIEQFENSHIKELPKMNSNGAYWMLWMNYFKDMFTNSPTLCNVYFKNKHLYTEKHFEPLVKECGSHNGTQTKALKILPEHASASR